MFAVLTELRLLDIRLYIRPLTAVKLRLDNPEAISMVNSISGVNPYSQPMMPHLRRRYLQYLALTAFLPLVICTQAQICPDVSSGLISWWRGDDSTADEAGLGNGTFRGDARYGTGTFGRALEFNGGQSALLVGDPEAFHVQNFTLEGWVRRSDTTQTSESPGGGIIFSGGTNSYGIALTHDGRLRVSLVGESYADSDPAITDLAWHHIAVTKRGSRVRYFVDGQRISESVYNVVFLFGTPFGIGGMADPVSGFHFGFKGSIDELALYSRPLIDLEIAELFRQGTDKCVAPAGGGCVPGRDGLAGYWPGSADLTDEVSGASARLRGDVQITPGIVDDAFRFGGGQSALILDNSTNLFLQRFTIDAWIRRRRTDITSDSPTGGSIVSGSPGAFSFTMLHDGRLGIGQVGRTRTEVPAAITDTDWHHVAVSYDGSESRFYIDGELRGLHSQGFQFEYSGPIAIGAIGQNIEGQSYSFLGDIDDIAIYSRVLPPREIEAIYESGSNGKCFNPVTARLVLPETLETGLSANVMVELINNGRTPRTNLTAALTIPGGIESTVPVPSTGELTNADGRILWTVPLLAPSAAARLEYVLGPINVGGRITNTVELSAPGMAPMTVSDSIRILGPCFDRPAGLVSWWRGEENATETLSGVSGQMRPGASFSQGWVGRSFRTDGRSGIVSLGNNPAWAIQNFSIETWIRRESLRATSLEQEAAAIFSAGQGGYGIGMFRDGSLYLAKQGAVAVRSTYGITDTNWHHIVVSRSDGVAEFFIDGQPSGQAAFIEQFEFGTSFAIGGMGTAFSGSHFGFLGWIDEVSLYDRRLTLDEVSGLFGADRYGKCIRDLAITASTPDAEYEVSGYDVNVTVRNLDRTPATDIKVSAPIAPGTAWLSGSAESGGLSNTASGVEWSLPALGGGRAATARLRFVPSPPQNGIITNLFSLTAGTGDESSSNNTAMTIGRLLTSCHPAFPDMRALWRGEDNAQDELDAHPGIASPSLVYAPGKVGRSFSFDGASGVEVATDPAFDLPAFTFEAWVHPVLLDGDVDIIASKEASGGGFDQIQFELGIRGPQSLAPPGTIPTGNLAYFIGGVTGLPNEYGGWSDGGAPVPLNEWSHVAITVDNGSGIVRTYVNGQLSRSALFSGTVPHIDATVRLGMRAPSPASGTGFNGGIDEVAVYGRALSGLEISSVFNADVLGRCLDDLSLGIFAPPPAAVATGEAFSYSLRAANRGPSPATAVRVTNLFDGLEFVGATNRAGASLAADGTGRFIWDIGTLDSGTNAEVTITLRAVSDGNHHVSATAVRAETDLTVANNQAAFDVESRPLTLRVTGPGSPAPENSGTLTATITLFPPSTRPVVVSFFTMDGSAMAGRDYLATNGDVTFSPGTTERRVEIALIDNVIPEDVEEFRFVLTNALGAEIATGETTLIIADDEPLPFLSVSPVRLVEGDSGRTPMRFIARLSVRTESVVTARFATLNDTARSGSDFLATNGLLTLLPGEMETHFDVEVLGDRTVEPNELFFVSLSNATNGALRTTNIPGVILNDDAVSGQLTGFRWSETPTNLVAAGSPIHAVLTATDGSGAVVRDFSGAVSIGAYPPGFRPATLVVSEISWQGNDSVEFQNVTSDLLNVSGWRVTFYDSTSWPVPCTSFVLPSGSLVAPREVFTLVEGSGAPNAFPNLKIGTSLAWRDNVPNVAADPIAVLVQNSAGDVVDFVGLDGAEAHLISLPVSLTEADWSGSSAGFNRFTSAVVQRRGSYDSNSATDWVAPSPNQSGDIGRTNLNLVLPFADAASLPIVPTTVLNFTNGVWEGDFVLGSPASLFALVADDGNGNTGVSAPIRGEVPNNLGISLVADALVVTNVAPIEYTLSVTNPGPETVTNVQVAVLVDRAINASGITFPGERPTVIQTDAPGVVLQWIAGDLAPHTNRMLVFRMRAPSSGQNPTILVNEARILPARDGDPSNDVAVSEVERAFQLIDLTSATKAWWTADLSEDGSSTNQSAPSGAPATLTGARRGPGRIGSGWVFDGAPGGVRIDPSPAINWSNNDSYHVVEGWIRTAPASGTGTMPVVGRGDTDSGWQINLVEGRTEFVVRRGGNMAAEPTLLESDQSLADDRWHHISLIETVAQQTVSLYIDGALHAMAPLTSLAGIAETMPLVFGADAEGRTFTGWMDEWAILNGPTIPRNIFVAGGFGKALYRLEIAYQAAPPPAIKDMPFTLGILVTNSGVGPAPDVRFTARVDRAADVSIRSSPGTLEVNSTNSASYTGAFGRMLAGETGTLAFQLTATNSGFKPVVLLSLASPSFRGRGTSLRYELSVSLDTDRDGMTDDWEIFYGFDPGNPADAPLDRDNDGSNNLAEFIAGTDPIDPASTFRLVLTRAENGGYRVRFQVPPYRNYVLEETVGLGSGTTWNPRASGTTSILTPVEVFSPEDSIRLFRARIQAR